jgi:hypothetical protein
VVLLAGISGTKLQVKIDCATFKANHPTEFGNCWSSCTGLLAPKSEYLLWVPEITSEMSIVNPSGAKRNCFTALFGYDLKVLTQQGKVQSHKGVTVFPMGLSPLTKNKSQANCGMDALTNLAPTLIQFGGFSQYRDQNTALINAGYKTGVNLQALPYDWRLGYQENSLNGKFKNVLKKLYETTGKKSLIVAHSFGNLQVVHNLWNMSQADKDKYVARYIALAPPYLGSSMLVSGTLGYNDSYTYNVVVTSLGILPYMFRDAIASSKGVFNLMPQTHLGLHKNKPWYKAMLMRMEAEKNWQDHATGTIMDVFPKVSDTCVNFIKDKHKTCRLDLYEQGSIGRVNGEEITPFNAGDIMEKYGVAYQTKKLWEENKDSRWETLNHPGVQVSIVYSASLGTPQYFNFKNDPRPETSKQNVVKPEYTFTYGDQSVNSASAIIPGIKWAQDFKDGEAGAKPIQFVEICSDYNKRESVFKGTSTQVSNNEYFGIGCGCKGSSTFPGDATKCDHVRLVSDAKTVEFILNSSVDY